MPIKIKMHPPGTPVRIFLRPDAGAPVSYVRRVIGVVESADPESRTYRVALDYPIYSNASHIPHYPLLRDSLSFPDDSGDPADNLMTRVFPRGTVLIVPAEGGDIRKLPPSQLPGHKPAIPASANRFVDYPKFVKRFYRNEDGTVRHSSSGARPNDGELTPLGAQVIAVVAQFLGRPPDYRSVNRKNMRVHITIRDPKAVRRAAARRKKYSGLYGLGSSPLPRNPILEENGAYRDESTAVAVAADALRDLLGSDAVQVETVRDGMPSPHFVLVCT